MRVVPVAYTADAAAMRRFLETLGLRPSWASDAGTWVAMDADGGGVGLHAAAAADEGHAAGTVELSFETDEELEAVAVRLHAAGFEAEIIDESFGRSLRTVDPDGRPLQVHEAMTDPYGCSRPQD